MKIINVENGKVIKSYCLNLEEEAVKQAINCALLPFTFRHVAIMPDGHMGYGIPIGGVVALHGAIIPNGVGKDIGCGMRAVRTGFRVGEICKDKLEKIIKLIKKKVPHGYSKNHPTPQAEEDMPSIEDNFEEFFQGIVYEEYEKARKALGTLGAGNHFIEIQNGSDGYIWIMIHTGSRNLGSKIADYYNDLACQLNKKWHTTIPEKWQLAFLPVDSREGQNYIAEMKYALAFAECNRKLMMKRIKEAFVEILPEATFGNDIDVHHNYAALENHFGKNVWVHRKGATSAKMGELGIIPGDQGSKSYTVSGLGNRESFMSCSHGAGRAMSRTRAKELLNLEDEMRKLDEKGIIHGMKTVEDLDEASGAYKDIAVVMEEQKDLVSIVVELEAIAVIKGPGNKKKWKKK